MSFINTVENEGDLCLPSPQPFSVTGFRLEGVNSKRLDTIYLETSALLASVPVKVSYCLRL